MGELSRGAKEFIEEAQSLVDQNPCLFIAKDEHGLPSLCGELLLDDEEGIPFDSYHVKIEFVSNYPFEFPKVFETGNRIPKNIDWHIFESDGHCCIKSMPEESLLCKRGITLEWFIKTQVKPYFYNQKYREIHGFFLKERSHGINGNNEFFKEIFRTENLQTIAKGLIYIKTRQKPNRVDACFCGSKLKFRKCHRDTYRLLLNLSDEELIYYAKSIITEGLG
ncbi:hypothetical protein BWI96_10615 [Siphonobacter sp. SORGH_AS_0500]|uniref:SEC-C metal-binding domain-containing protein n=1 Tax=Siphonobacter sp. SORGH_AS_0500 TaxID=1864824 RepID=UPI000CB1DE10|nr:SEC-C metal-binding domain-containing protein [Siphonobacter sp. SORGH_AS_0500]PKK36814.1 hypothetical protein BWI96_10615 [Siphonobacter sp. SORGH_AS_0500]